MRKLMTILLLSLFFVSKGQMVTRMMPMRAAHDTAAPSGWCTEYQTVYDLMSSPPDNTNAGYQNDMVQSLVTGGYWDRMDVFYCFATANGTDALVSWIDPEGDDNATNVSSTSFTAYEGFTGDGSADYLNTNYNPNSEGDNFTQNSGTLGIYLRVNVASGTKYDCGVESAGNQVSLTASYNENAYCRINSTTADSYSNADNRGCYIATRRSSSNQELYKNGSSLSESTSNTSVTIPNYNIYVLGRNGAGTLAYPSDNQVSIFFVMDGVSDAEASAINTILETYMDAISKGVQ